MRPTSFALPNISMIHSDRSLVDLKNQYSILNRFQCKDALSSYSLELDLKLPKLNNRLKTINEKENQLKDKENRMLNQKQMLNSFAKQIQDMKKYLLQNTNRCYCNCNSLRMSQIYPYQCHNNCSCNQKNLSIKSNQKNSQRTIPKQKTQQIKKKKGKTFRKYAYAVYFCLFLKHFSSKFTKNRYDFFKQRYLKNDGQKVKQDSYRITKSLEVIDLVKILIQSSPSISQVSSLTLSSQNQIPQTQLIPKKNEDKFKKALNFVNLYLKEMQKVVLSQKFTEFYGQIIGIGTIKQAFFMDDLMIPQQIQFITFSEKKGFAMISPETQNILITIYVFIKHILFKILLKIKEKKYLEQKFKGQYEEFMAQSDQIYDFIELASALLYRTVNNLFLDYLQEKGVKTNYDKLRKRFKISPAKNLAAPGCPNELKQTVNYKELILGVKRIKEAQYFCQNSAFDEYLDYLSAKVSQISFNLLQKVRQVNAVIYNHIKEQTLNQSYLIFEGIKNEQNAKMKTGKTLNQLNPLPVKSRALFNQVSKSNIKLSNTSLGNNSKLNNMDNSKNATKSKFMN